MQSEESIQDIVFPVSSAELQCAVNMIVYGVMHVCEPKKLLAAPSSNMVSKNLV
jgi:hypothetical protein